MRGKLVLISLILALATAVSAQEKRVAPETGVPKVTMGTTTWNFGPVNAGEPLTHTFKIKNTGTGDLLIKAVTPS